MNLILTSDFPTHPTDAVVARMRAVAPDPRIAWIPSHTDAEGLLFANARAQFGALALPQLECVDIDEDRDDVQIAYLHEFDIIYLSGEDPLRFRYNAIRTGLSGRLRQCAAAGRLIVGAGAGAMLLTPNVSLYRLQTDAVDDVIESRGRYDTLGAVSYEVLPHSNQLAPAVLDRVRQYSSRISHDIVLMCDGSAIFPTGTGTFDVVGRATRYRGGAIIEELT
jgi:peptidase E